MLESGESSKVLDVRLRFDNGSGISLGLEVWIGGGDLEVEKVRERGKEAKQLTQPVEDVEGETSWLLPVKIDVGAQQFAL